MTPPSDQHRLRWLVAVIMLGAGALNVLAILPLPDPDPSDHRAFALLGAGLGVATLVLLAAGPRSRAGGAAFVGVVAVSVFVAVARPTAAVPLFYLWPVLHSAYFGSRRQLVATEVLLLVTYPVALTFAPTGVRASYFVSVVTCMVVVGAVVFHLKQRVDRLVAELDTTANTDPLTGLLNRRAFQREFELAVERADQRGRPLTLAVFDLDHFKLVNDVHGHALGDRALVRTAATLQAERRKLDLAARLGGEEFALLLIDTAEPEAHLAVQRIARELAHNHPDDAVHLSVSVGLAEFGPGLETCDALLLAADDALYEAKEAGRGRVASHEGDMTVTAV